MLQRSEELPARVLTQDDGVAEGDGRQQLPAAHLAGRDGRTDAAAVDQRRLRPLRTRKIQKGISQQHAAETFTTAAGCHTVGRVHVMTAHLPGLVAFKPGRMLCRQGGDIFPARRIGRQLTRPAPPAHRDAPRIEAHGKVAQIARAPCGRHHQHRLAGRRTLHEGIRPHRRAGPQIAVRMAAHDDVHPVHLTGKLTVGRQAQMGQHHDASHALRFQFRHGLPQAFRSVAKARPRTGLGLRRHTVIGQSHDADGFPMHLSYQVGLDAAAEQRTAPLRRDIGRHDGYGLCVKKSPELAAALVKFMVAQGHGVIGHAAVVFGQHGPLFHRIEQRPLKLIPRIQRQHIVPFAPCGVDGGGYAAHAAPAGLVRGAGLPLCVHTGQKGVGVVGVQDADLSALRRFLPASLRQADGGQQPQQRKTCSAPQEGSSPLFRLPHGVLRNGPAGRRYT